MLARLPVRQPDKYGSGGFNAARGSRRHQAIDYACYPRTGIVAQHGAQVTKVGRSYSDDLSFRYVETTLDDGGYRIRYHYVEPAVRKGDRVEPGDLLGFSQTLQDRYPKITDHVHVEVYSREGKKLNAEKFFEV